MLLAMEMRKTENDHDSKIRGFVPHSVKTEYVKKVQTACPDSHVLKDCTIRWNIPYVDIDYDGCNV